MITCKQLVVSSPEWIAEHLYFPLSLWYPCLRNFLQCVFSAVLWWNTLLFICKCIASILFLKDSFPLCNSTLNEFCFVFHLNPLKSSFAMCSVSERPAAVLGPPCVCRRSCFAVSRGGAVAACPWWPFWGATDLLRVFVHVLCSWRVIPPLWGWGVALWTLASFNS